MKLETRVPLDRDLNKRVHRNSENNIRTYAEISVRFNNHADAIIEELKNCDGIIGCVAWFTDRPILSYLENLKYTSVIFNADVNMISYYKWFSKLDRTPFLLKAGDIKSKISSPYFSVFGVPNPSGGPNMHHKFLVFLKKEEDKIDGWNSLIPYKVVTGSFNFTTNGRLSLDNTIAITSDPVCHAYTLEFLSIRQVAKHI